MKLSQKIMSVFLAALMVMSLDELFKLRRPKRPAALTAFVVGPL